MPHFHAVIPTTSASSSMNRLCRSLSQRVPVMHDQHHARLEFPFGQCRIRATETGLQLECRVRPGMPIERLQCALTCRLRRCCGEQALEPVWEKGLLPVWGAA